MSDFIIIQIVNWICMFGCFLIGYIKGKKNQLPREAKANTTQIPKQVIPVKKKLVLDSVLSPFIAPYPVIIKPIIKKITTKILPSPFNVTIIFSIHQFCLNMIQKCRDFTERNILEKIRKLYRAKGNPQ